MRALGIAWLWAFGAGVIVCLLFWPYGSPPPSDDGKLIVIPPEMVAIGMGVLASIVAGIGALLVMFIGFLLRPRAPRVPTELQEPEPAPLPRARVVVRGARGC